VDRWDPKSGGPSPRQLEELQRSAGGAGGGSGVDTTVAAFALLEIEESFEETSTVEVGPKNIGDEEFGVRDLPEKEIADAHFSAGADEEIGIGKVGGIEMTSELLFADGLGGGVAVMTPAFGENGVHGIDKFGAAAVVESDRKNHTAVACGGVDGVARVLLDRERQVIGSAKEAHTNVVALDERHFVANILAKQLHEKFNFSFGAAPVFDGESVEGEGFDVEASAGFDGGASGFGAGAVADNAGEMTLLGPTAVAIHDDSDMAGEAGNIEFFEKTGFFGGDRAERVETKGLGESVMVRVGHGKFANPLYAAKLTQWLVRRKWEES